MALPIHRRSTDYSQFNVKITMLLTAQAQKETVYYDFDRVKAQP
jgi:hypothetical protein